MRTEPTDAPMNDIDRRVWADRGGRQVTDKINALDERGDRGELNKTANKGDDDGKTE